MYVTKAGSLQGRIFAYMELGRKNIKAKRLLDGVTGNELTFQQNTSKVFPSSKKGVSKL